MRLLLSILICLSCLSLSAKEYSLSGDSFSAKIEIGTEDFLNNPYFNLDITTSENAKIDLPKDFQDKFFIENFEKKSTENGRLYRYILIMKSYEDFTLDAIKISNKIETLSFENISFTGLNKEVQAPEPMGIFIEEEPKWKYYLILVLTLLCSIVFCVKKRKANVKTIALNLSDLYDIKEAKAFSEALFRHLNKFLPFKYHYMLSGKSASEIAEFLRKNGLEHTASFIENSTEIMYSDKSIALDENTQKLILEELEGASKNEV
ncbi:MAG: hypothetical protein R3Y46_00770 [Opitutales bacterium]